MSIQQAIENQLSEQFECSHIELLNESHMHSVPENSETHFKLTLVSQVFAGQSKVKRHQMIYQALATFLSDGVHALALHLYTEDEWLSAGHSVPESPNCMGGSAKG